MARLSIDVCVCNYHNYYDFPTPGLPHAACSLCKHGYSLRFLLLESHLCFKARLKPLLTPGQADCVIMTLLAPTWVPPLPTHGLQGLRPHSAPSCKRAGTMSHTQLSTLKISVSCVLRTVFEQQQALNACLPNEWIEGWMDGWMDRRGMGGWMDEWINESSCRNLTPWKKQTTLTVSCDALLMPTWKLSPLVGQWLGGGIYKPTSLLPLASCLCH